MEFVTWLNPPTAPGIWTASWCPLHKAQHLQSERVLFLVPLSSAVKIMSSHHSNKSWVLVSPPSGSHWTRGPVHASGAGVVAPTKLLTFSLLVEWGTGLRLPVNYPLMLKLWGMLAPVEMGLCVCVCVWCGFWARVSYCVDIGMNSRQQLTEGKENNLHHGRLVCAWSYYKSLFRRPDSGAIIHISSWKEGLVYKRLSFSHSYVYTPQPPGMID